MKKADRIQLGECSEHLGGFNCVPIQRAEERRHLAEGAHRIPHLAINEEDTGSLHCPLPRIGKLHLKGIRPQNLLVMVCRHTILEERKWDANEARDVPIFVKEKRIRRNRARCKFRKSKAYGSQDSAQAKGEKGNQI